MTDVDRTTQAAWTALMTKSRQLLETVEAALKSAGHPPLSWYDALLELEKVGEEGIRPFELRQRLLLPQYGTSRLLDRMVTAGLVNRRDCEEDGRGQIVFISERGLAIRKAMWPEYSKVLTDGIGDKLTRAEAVQLAMLLSKL
ncbi:MarR family transcriptional regulator [Rhodospirillaceae bacterium KN72]|uniref:MarR family transcriptional regulator n=1 Tax=Pacificispira spongiicola TaxID=2729598 RepID=A0A7Y0E2G8_9PROT|nr:helix-turn-helix domain-containing protein [Pacificispira spongiicola]NMM46018.1 MarR family transcriptional regulator [Pacificispira spongiicola]